VPQQSRHLLLEPTATDRVPGARLPSSRFLYGGGKAVRAASPQMPDHTPLQATL
jgi:hypothetical protein